MNKTFEIDLSEDRLLAIASDYLEEHNLIGALKMLNKNAVLNGNAEDSYMLYAETFDDMQLYEQCINGWFKYIDYAEDAADLSDAYEGIAVSFLNLGQENFAAFYYNRLLMESDEGLSKESREQIIDAFLSAEKNPLKFVYPPRLADYSEEIEKGIDYMRSNDYENAVSQFEKVGEGSDKHLAARNYIAMCRIICDQCEQAEEECLNILKTHPDNVQALTTLAAVRTQQQKTEESKLLAEKLLSLNTDNPEDVYKIATVCCENGMHEAAYQQFCKLENELAYDTSVLYFKAVSAYNSGFVDKSLEAFDKLLTIDPDAVTAKYYQDIVRESAGKPQEERQELSYFYRLPQSERESNLQFLTAFSRLSKANAQALTSEIDVSDCIKWCFDEREGSGSIELRILGAVCAVKAGLDDMVRDILLDAFSEDRLKMELLSAIALKNEGKTYGVVICNIYRRLNIPKLNVGKLKRKNFLRAYAVLVSRFAILNSDYIYLLNAAATTLYNRLAQEERLDECGDVLTLSAAIYLSSGIKEIASDIDSVCAFFGADKNKLNKLVKNSTHKP